MASEQIYYCVDVTDIRWTGATTGVGCEDTSEAWRDNVDILRGPPFPLGGTDPELEGVGFSTVIADGLTEIDLVLLSVL